MKEQQRHIQIPVKHIQGKVFCKNSEGLVLIYLKVVESGPTSLTWFYKTKTK